MVKPKKANLSTSMRQYRKLINKLVLIVWGDAYEHLGRNYNLPYKKHLTKTVGFLADEDKKRVYVSMYHCGIAKKFASPYVAIPKGMIEKLYTLKGKI